MVSVRWTKASGWEAPELKPYGPLSLMPTASVFHYATECFEGLKLYRGFDGKLRLFRAGMNCQRMLMSAQRIALPSFDPTELEKLIRLLCGVDASKWLSQHRAGEYLYIRPTMIGTGVALGVQAPVEALLYIILAPFPDFKATPAMRLLASAEGTVRAWPGGCGYAKVGANYGPALVAQRDARAKGYDQVLWLMGSEGFVTEAGASNFFVLWKSREGVTQLVTTPVDHPRENIILDGVTRRSVLNLARELLSQPYQTKSGNLDAVQVVEQRFTMCEIIDAVDEGRLLEVFVTGTAYFLLPVCTIHYSGQDWFVSPAYGETGAYTSQFQTWLEDIMFGRKEHPWCSVVDDLGDGSRLPGIMHDCSEIQSRRTDGSMPPFSNRMIARA